MKARETIRLAINGRTDIGQVRDENEDYIGWYTHPQLPLGFVVLADGMGGYTGGAKASHIAVNCVVQHLEKLPTSTFQACTPDQQLLIIHTKILESLNAANAAILDKKVVSPKLENMGSTIVLGLVWQDKVTIAHLGDSRAYLWNREGLCQLTSDHSLVQEMIDSGSLTVAQARSNSARNHITKALGVGDFIEPSINTFPLTQNTLLMLCSDGLTEYLDHEVLEFVLSTHRPALECCYRFISDANQLGGKDNISVGIIEYTVQNTADIAQLDSGETKGGVPVEDVTVRKESRV